MCCVLCVLSKWNGILDRPMANSPSEEIPFWGLVASLSDVSVHWELYLCLRLTILAFWYLHLRFDPIFLTPSIEFEWFIFPVLWMVILSYIIEFYRICMAILSYFILHASSYLPSIQLRFSLRFLSVVSCASGDLVVCGSNCLGASCGDAIKKNQLPIVNKQTNRLYIGGHLV